MIDSALIMSCFLLSIMGWFLGICAIFTFVFYSPIDSGGEFGWIEPLLLFCRFAVLSCVVQVLSIIFGVIHFYREHFIFKEFHKLCTVGFLLSMIYLFCYIILYGTIWIGEI